VKQKKSSRHITSLDSLGLSNRRESRHPFYQGETEPVTLKGQATQAVGHIFDLSPLGVALLVETSEFHLHESVQIFFHPLSELPFSLSGKIVHKTPMTSQGKIYLRYGIQFSLERVHTNEVFLSLIQENGYPCHGESFRPSGEGITPFSFSERLFFSVYHIYAKGVILSISDRCKWILPHMRLALSFSLPGGRHFEVKGEVQPFFYMSEGRHHFYFVYEHPSVSFLQAWSEYLVAFEPNMTPKMLRENGFQVGSLQQAFHVEPVQNNTQLPSREAFYPAFSGGLAVVKENISPDHTRYILCKLGTYTVAYVGIRFATAGMPLYLVHSDLKAQLFTGGSDTRYMEIVGLYMNGDAKLVDFFLPLLQHLVRIGLQSHSLMIYLECAPPFRKVLARLGFQEISPSHTSIMVLSLTRLMQEDKKMVGESVWNQLYEELVSYMHKSHPEEARS